MPFTESPARLPGWTMLRNPDTKSARYRAPDGTEVGAFAYSVAMKQYDKTGIPPQSPLGSKWKHYQSNYSKDKKDSNQNTLQASIPGPDDEPLILEVPEPHSTPASRTKSGLFSAKELSGGFMPVLVILTTLIAAFSKIPEAQMTEQEVRAISIPFGNIVERSKYNRVIGNAVVGKGDYFTLGFALYSYVDRVRTAAGERKNYEPFGTTQQATPGYTGTNGTGPAGPAVSLRVAPQGLRGIVGND